MHKIFQCSKKQLQNQIKIIHEDHKAFECQSCGKLFTQAGHMRNHIKTIHKGHKDFKCDFCEIFLSN